MTTQTTPTHPELDRPQAHVMVTMSGRPMMLCHEHAQALIDLADGNGVRLEISAMLPEPPEPCWACRPRGTGSGIITLDV